MNAVDISIEHIGRRLVALCSECGEIASDTDGGDYDVRNTLSLLARKHADELHDGIGWW